MSSIPLVSVYLPTKNRLAQLERAVSSVLEQTYAELELIVVNDGSSDGTQAYLERVRERDPRLRVIHNVVSVGAPRSRNLAIEASCGEFVTGLDDDDSFHPERIAAFVELWRRLCEQNEPVAALYAQDFIVAGDKQTETRKPSSVVADRLFFYNEVGNQIFTRREYFVQAGLFDEDMPAWQDLDAFIRVLRRFGPARLLDRPLYYLNVDPRPDRISMGSRQKLATAYRRISAKYELIPAVMRQGLFLQQFGPLYAHKPSLSDLREFLSYGLHVRTAKRLLGVYIARSTGSW